MKEFQYLHQEITGKIIKSFYQVYNHIGYGFTQPVYLNALHTELQKEGLASEINKSIEIHYKSVHVGNFTADILVENTVFIRISTHEKISETDEQILYNQLKVSFKEVGILLNFGIQPEHKRRESTNQKS